MPSMPIVTTCKVVDARPGCGRVPRIRIVVKSMYYKKCRNDGWMNVAVIDMVGKVGNNIVEMSSNAR